MNTIEDNKEKKENIQKNLALIAKTEGQYAVLKVISQFLKGVNEEQNRLENSIEFLDSSLGSVVRRQAQKIRFYLHTY